MKRVESVMTKDVATVSPDAPVTEAANLMQDLDIGFVPVVEDGRPIGVLTDRDIVVRCVARGIDVTECKVRDVMTTQIVTCGRNDTVALAAELMEEHKVRRLLVVNGDGVCLGVVSVADMAVGNDGETLAGEVLHEVSAASR